MPTSSWEVRPANIPLPGPINETNLTFPAFIQHSGSTKYIQTKSTLVIADNSCQYDISDFAEQTWNTKAERRDINYNFIVAF